METEQICWELLYDTEAETIRMPEPNVEKAMHLLVDPSLDYGREDIDYKFLEQYMGQPTVLVDRDAINALHLGSH